MSVVEVARLVRLLQEHPEWGLVLHDALHEEHQHQRAPADSPWLGFEADDVHAHRRLLDQMVVERILYVSYRSRAFKHYRVEDVTAVAAALEAYERGRLVPVTTPEAVSPRELFRYIVGHEDTKEVIWRALEADHPTHILLVGPVASAKSMFLQDLLRLPNSRYCLAGSARRVGLEDILFEEKPTYLLIDEIDHADNPRDLDVLLELMQSGKVTRVKHAIRDIVELRCWVFGAANATERIRDPLLSRFWRVDLKPYSLVEFKKVVQEVLVARDGISPELADYIAGKVGEVSRDVRKAVLVANLARSPADVDWLLKEATL